jgi:phenylacetate-coenzyme A ligase PaaK-like adenylate-forming protein
MSFWKEAKHFPKLVYQQWRSSSHLAESGHHRLQRLINPAYKQVPYYRRLLMNTEQGQKRKKTFFK